MSDKKPDRILQERHRYDFSDQERSALGLKLARATRELDDLQEQKKDATKAIAEEIAEVRKQIRSLTAAINDGWDLRMVEVHCFYHCPSNGLKRKVRMDTGEIVSDEPMTDEERQQVFPGMDEFKQAQKDSPAAELAPENSQAGEVGVSSEGQPESADTDGGSQGDVTGTVQVLDGDGQPLTGQIPIGEFNADNPTVVKAMAEVLADPPAMKRGICSACSASTYINADGLCLNCETGKPVKKRRGKSAAAGADA